MPDIVITRDYFGGKEGIQTILNDYYEREIGKLPDEQEHFARRFIEEGLIVNGKRVGLAEGVEKAQFGVEETLLRQLLESRLIRAETIHLGKIYEISHDTLVEPILRSYQKRKFEEEKKRAQQILEEEKAKRREAERRRNRAKLFALLGFTLFFIALVAGFIAFNAYRAAEKARQEAVAAREMAQDEQRKTEEAYGQLQLETQQREEAQFNEILERGKARTAQSDYAMAADEFQLALDLRPDDPEARLLLQQARQKAGVKSRFVSLIAEGDALAAAGNPSLVAAREKYRQALSLHFNDVTAKSRLTALEGPLGKYFSELVTNADIYFNADGYAEALELYQRALQIRDDAHVKSQIPRCREKIAGNRRNF
jgi:tetratricopeptide (TPR) repeat protein